ncbi:MAG: oligosaccharide flippase family protein [Flavobacteriales bacterium]|nr:oligosaccharide flippase family protein [Flavobacteriales bacterium]
MVPRIVSFFLIPVYTQYLSPDDYGIVELCGSLGLVIMTLMRLGIPGSVSRFYFDHKDNEQELKNYVTTVHHFLVFASLAVGSIVAVLFYFFSENITPGLLFFPFVVIVLINSAFSANSDLQRRLLQSSEQSRYSAVLSIFTAFFGIATAILFVVGFKMGALGILYSQLITTFIFFIQAQFFLKKYTNGKFNRPMLKSSVKYGIHTLPHLLFILLAPFLSKIILVKYASIAALGIYSLASRFVQPLQLLYTAFNQSYTPIYYSMRKEGVNVERINAYSRLIWVASCILFMGTMFILPPLIPLITPPRFHASAALVPLLSSGFIWMIIYFLASIDLFYTKQNKYMGIITLGGIITNVAITLIFVNPYGSEALAWAQLFGFVCWAILAKYLVDRFGEFKLIKGVLWQTAILSASALFLERYVLTSEWIFLRIFTFLVISSILVYLFVIRNPETFGIVRRLKFMQFLNK